MTDAIFKSLNEIYKTLESYRIEKNKTELYDANRFNPFQFIETDENGLSSIIAFFLNPLERHGQRDLFLITFLKNLKLYDFLAYDNIVITCEKATYANRRHDIFIEGWLNNQRKWIISIENKLKNAMDQDNQLSDYHKDLQSYRVPFYLIYLPPFKRFPPNESISKEEWQQLTDKHHAQVLDTKDIIRWLEQTPIIAPNIKLFCDNFIAFLKDEIMNEIENHDKFLEQLITNKAWLETAISLIESAENLYEKLDTLLIQQLQQKFEQEFPIMYSKGWYFNSDGYSSGFYLDKGDIDKQAWGIGLEFDSNNYKNAYYGIWARKEELSKEKYEQLETIFPYSGFKRTKYWIHWKWCDHNLKDWNSETWKNIANGELAEQIFELLRPLIYDTDKNILVLEGLSCK